MILADPAFDASDPRVTASRQAPGVPGQARQVAAWQVAARPLAADRQLAARKPADTAAAPVEGLGRLAFSRQEAQAIAAQAPGEVATALDFAATCALAVSGRLRDFRYLHFAARVVASLWWIDDLATAELMGKLYQGLWRQRLTPAAALRQARLAVAGARRALRRRPRRGSSGWSPPG